MPLTTEQIKDLQPFKVSELVIDGRFYIKQADGTFEACVVYQWELDQMQKRCMWKIDVLRLELQQLSKEGRLFRMNK